MLNYSFWYICFLLNLKIYQKEITDTENMNSDEADLRPDTEVEDEAGFFFSSNN